MTRKDELEKLLKWIDPCDHAQKIIDAIDAKSPKELWDKYPYGTDLAWIINFYICVEDELDSQIERIVVELTKTGVTYYGGYGCLPISFVNFSSRGCTDERYADLIRKHLPWRIIRKACRTAGEI